MGLMSNKFYSNIPIIISITDWIFIFEYSYLIHSIKLSQNLQVLQKAALSIIFK